VYDAGRGNRRLEHSGLRLTRYFLREVLTHTLVVSLVLLAIILSGRFVKYLAEAAAGDLAADVLLPVMWYRLPGFLELTLPLGLFIGILMAYGRLYIDSEMVVMSACGVGPKELARFTLLPSLVVALLVGALSLYITPMGAAKSQNLLDDPKSRQGLSTLTAGRFQVPRGGGRVTYAEEISPAGDAMRNVLMVDWEFDESGDPQLTVLIAASGELHSQQGKSVLKLFDGRRYQGNPGDTALQVLYFDVMAERIREPRGGIRNTAPIDGEPSVSLLARSDTAAIAAMQWRFSTPLLVPVVALLALAMSRTDQRRGRYLNMAPALMLYLVYLLLLSNGRAAVEKGSWPPLPGLWLIHALILALAIVLLLWPQWRMRWAAR
jgi:lipopolysaccharide export system permease protein